MLSCSETQWECFVHLQEYNWVKAWCGTHWKTIRILECYENCQIYVLISDSSPTFLISKLRYPSRYHLKTVTTIDLTYVTQYIQSGFYFLLFLISMCAFLCLVAH
jgi:hypothetical protein